MASTPDPDTGFEDRWRSRFGRYGASHDDDASIAGWTSTGLAARLRHFATHWKPDPPGALWLDAGCGAGTYTRFLTQQGMRAIGMDYSLPSLVKANARGGALGWANADVKRLPVEPGAFDGALCFGVTQALADSTPAVRELLAALRPGGVLWIDALNARCALHMVSNGLRRLRGRPDHLRYESPRRLRRIMEAAGASEVRLIWLPIVPGRWQRFQAILESRPVARLLHAVPPLGALLSHSFVLVATKAGQDR